jgi:hypothetical protein
MVNSTYFVGSSATTLNAGLELSVAEGMGGDVNFLLAQSLGC